MVQTVGLALATDLVAEEDQPKVVGLMYVMLLLGMVVSALVFGALLENYTPGRLVQVIQGAAVTTVALNLAALWKQESRSWARAQAARPDRDFGRAWGRFIERPGALALLGAIGLGTFGYGMADVLLEPYGGQALGLTVAQTTKLTAVLAAGTLGGFAIASKVLSGPARATMVALWGAGIGVPGFAAIIASSAFVGPSLFVAGTFATGLGAGLFGHATLTATMRAAPREQVGLALGAWGAVQATAAGIGVALGGVVRDVLVGLPGREGAASAALPYNAVFAIEIVFLVLAVVALLALQRTAARNAPDPNRLEVA
jgi:BCD family chlorophyll transporter-like MFS transporter